MSKEIDTQQILLQEDSHANPSALQEREKEQTMTATSGMKLLESSESVNLDGSLGKMLKALLTSKKAWSSDRCVMTWKKKVSKSNVLLFQLQASVRGIKGKEFGLLHTPTATEIGMRSPEAMEKRKKYRESIGRKTVPPGNLLEQIQMMLSNSGSKRSQGFNNQQEPSEQKLDHSNNHDENVWNTKSTRQSSSSMGPGKGEFGRTSHEENKRKLVGSSIQNFVEFLMGYPMNWTKIEPTE